VPGGRRDGDRERLVSVAVPSVTATAPEAVPTSEANGASRSSPAAVPEPGSRVVTKRYPGPPAFEKERAVRRGHWRRVAGPDAPLTRPGDPGTSLEQADVGHAARTNARPSWSTVRAEDYGVRELGSIAVGPESCECLDEGLSLPGQEAGEIEARRCRKERSP